MKSEFLNMSSQTARIAELSKEKQELLLKRIKEKSVFVNQGISKRTVFSPCPLSFAQERLWFLVQMESDNPFYNMAGVVQLLGNLNIPVLEQALNEVVRRHEVLRTSFVMFENKAQQFIDTDCAISVKYIDLMGLNDLQQKSTVKTLEVQEAHRVFDLKQKPLLRATLIKLNDERYMLLMSLHHIVADEWSLRLLIKEFGEYYQTFRNGTPSFKPELTIQYADFALWQRNRLQGELNTKQIEYWRHYLETAPTFLELPTDKPRPKIMTYCGASYHFELSQEISATLFQLSQKTDTSLFVVMMAAFNVLLSRYSGQNDLCVGYPIANRNHLEIENLIGFFVNTQVLRTDLSGNPTFTGLLNRVRKNILDAQNNQDLPFERLVEELKLDRELNRTALFQVMLVYQNAPMESLDISELSVNVGDAQMNSAKFDLSLNVSRSEKNLNCSFNYSTDLFDETTIVRMTKHLQQLLESIVTNPNSPVSELSLLMPIERQQILLDWNATEVGYPKEHTIHQLFETQAAKTPNAIAVVFEEYILTYAELNAKANQLAHYLRTKGVVPDVLVGLCVERSVEMVTALLAILKAGGAYLPLDPDYPQDRLRFMLEDVKPPVILTQAGLLEKLSFGITEVLCLDTEWNKVASEIATNPSIPLMPENLAYCIYTSGSTGQPKGVCVPHQGILNRLQWMQEYYQLDDSDVVLQKTPYSFDVSVWEFFWPLMTGAKLIVARPNEHKDSMTLIDTIICQQVTTIHFVPSMLHAFIDTPDVETCTSLKRVLCSGEALPADLVVRFQQKFQAELHNLYGPTEASVDVSFWTCLPESTETAIPIGRPIANIALYIFDRQLNPVPVGTPGELHIGGVGLGRGYLKRPELTAEKFIPNPYGQEGSRLYKTGDLVRYRADGNIDYLGRIDHQVKIRGFRIELGEIETRLLEHPDIKEAVVIVQEVRGGDKRLVAYLVEKLSGIVETETLKAFFKASLPDYMIPGIYVKLETMPLSANGKLDRKRLPTPDLNEQLVKQYIAPHTVTEEILAGIWEDLLGIEKIGIEDNFFELGGHSLLAMQAISRMVAVLRVDLPIRQLFEFPTIAEFAHRIDNNSLVKKTVFPIESVNRQQTIPLSYAQQRLWFLEQLEPGNISYNMPIALRLSGRLNNAALTQSFNEIVRRHENLRTVFVTNNGVAEQKIVDKLMLPVESVDLSKLSEQNRETGVRDICRQQAEKPFSLATGALIRVMLVKVGDDKEQQESILLVTLHHIISDGWSSKLLIREFTRLYEAFCAGKASPLAELSLQYADFAYWQRQWLAGDILQQQINYWREKLGGAPAILDLPTDHPRPPIMRYCGADCHFTVPQLLSEQLHTLSRRHDATLFMTLLAAFNVLLFRYSHQTDLCVGTPIANRNRLEIENLIGFFVNTLIVRSDLSGNPVFSDLLSQIRNTVLDAQDYQDLPFEQLLEVLQAERDMSYSPLFQVMFVLQNGDQHELVLPGLDVGIVKNDSSITKFDLSLHIHEHADGLLSGTLEYNTDLFEHDTIVHLSEHYLELLQAIVSEPKARISELPLLTHDDQQLILLDWNNTQVDYPQGKYIHQLFEQQAEQSPDAVAVVFDNSQLSYAELNTKANQLAHYLQKQGVGPDVPVGICIERSLEMIVGLLGILKAGGAYVPLDPAYPQERLDFMINDTGTPILLTQSGLLEKFAFSSASSLCLDTQWSEVAIEARSNPVVSLRPENLAYCIYTSGSTGQPKGAVIPHQGILNRLQWMQEAYQLNETDRVLQKTPFSFDVSVWEFFWPLMTGAALVFALPEEHKDSIALINTIVRNNITTIHFVPSMLQAFIDTPDVELCSSLTRVICSGEALSVELVQGFYQKLAAQLHNLYGPTEASVDVSSWFCDQEHVGDSIAIGKPIANIALYILDQQLNLVPVGAQGELHIGGIGLARGYLNRANLTAEKFIPDPFGQSGSRLYKTGDLVRYLKNGDIEYLGRIDHQVKIRGFRIELGEIEARLLEQAQIREAVVITRKSQSGENRLLAYLVEVQQGCIQIEALRSVLKEKLPDYMIPAAFVLLKEMPLSSNGKLDRKALPTPDMSEQITRHYIAPQTYPEKILATIWSELLGIAQVGVYDNFFELGGDSILSIQVVSRARQAGINITPRQLFQYQTIASLAIAAIQNTVISAEQGLVTGNIPLTPIQKWFFEQTLSNPHHWNQALMFEAKPGFEANTLEHAVYHLIIHHDALRLQFIPDKGIWTQINRKELPDTWFERIDLSALASDQQISALELAASEQQALLNLTQGRLVRVVWFDLGKHQNNRILIIIHHLVVDGVSWRILLEDLSTVCHQLMSGLAVSLPAKTTSFKQWSKQINEQNSLGLLQLDADYWLNPLRNQISELPIDEPAGKNTAATEITLGIVLSETETKALLQEVPLAYHTKIDEVLIAALAQTLVNWTHNPMVLVDLEGHGREDIINDLDVSRTVGWFTSLYPALLNLAAQTTPGEVLKSVKEQLRNIPQKGVGYGLLRYLAEANNISEKLALLTGAQVIFNYLGQFDTTLSADSPYMPAKESTGLSSDPDNIRSHEISIISNISGGQLQLNWSFSGERYHRTTIEALTQDYLSRLKSLIAHCQLPDTGGYTPSDFPLISLSQSELDAMALSPRQIEDIYPLAPLQYGLLFHSLYAPDTGVYCIQLGCQLNGKLDMLAFKQAWQYVVDKYTVLRTRFYFEKQQKPLQSVLKHVELPIALYDWRAIPNEEQSVQLQKLLADDQKSAFDFTRAPLMRLGLVQCSDTQHYFLWSYHHLLLDGWSGPLLIKEVFAAYEKLTKGENIAFSPERPFRDYVAWLQTQDMEAAETYWKKTLAGFTAPTPLFADKAGNHSLPHDNGDKNTAGRSLSVEKTKMLQDFVKHHQLTLNTLMQAAWILLLSRYSGEYDIVFGATVSGRPAELCRVETMIGLFINTLPIRVQVLNNSMTIDWLKSLFTQNQEIRRYEYTPLTQIQAWSDIKRGLPLFESLLVFENYPIDQALTQKFNALNITDISVIDQTNYPLTVSVFPGSELRLEIAYNLNRFDDGVVLRMLEHLENTLLAFVDYPFVQLGELPMLSSAENQQMLIDWNDTQVDYPKAHFIHQLFEKQVEETPDALAVVFDNRTLSYAELNAKANQLAHYLLHKAVKPDTLVGICMERSLEMVIGLLGILKAGCAYLPLDPAYPQQRLDFMISDSNMPIVLAQGHSLCKLDAFSASVLCLDTHWSEVSGESMINPCISLKPENLAYCIYTSGSTGRPKGVGVPHQGILNRLQWMQEAYGLNEADRVLQKTPFSFDVSVWEFFWPLMTGAALIVAKPEEHKNSQALIETIVQHAVTTIHFVPSMLQAFIDTQGVETYTSLKRVICSGEALPAELVQRFYQKSAAQLHNLYGPTEASVDVTYWACEQDKIGDSIPIGRPIANISIYLLDKQLNPVPVGTPGELHIGGIGLARGYINRADLTAEKFIPNSFGEAGSRLYKTGDLARYQADGNIEYLGRIDHQVKIRGFRIELGEIEARLLEHPDIKEAAVIAIEVQSGEKRLMAYIVENIPEKLTTQTLQAYLKEKLPDYMIPGSFVFLESMPLSANGKLDRKALPAPDFCEQFQKRYVAPGTVTEEILAGIWGKVLGLVQVGIDDNFFELGGDSILSLQIVNLARGRDLDITLEQLYKEPTIRQLAVSSISVQSTIALSSYQYPFSLINEVDRISFPEGVEDAYPLTVLQAGMIFHSEYDKNAYHLIDSARLRCKLDLAALQAAIQQVVVRHPVLRTSFDLGNYSVPLQLVFCDDKVTSKINFDDWRTLSAEQQKEQLADWLEQEKSRIFDISKAPLLRFHIHQLTDEIFQFTVTEHHAILDGWSLISMLNEIFTRYLLLLNLQSVLNAVPVPANALRDLVVWEREAIKSEQCRNFWQQKISDANHSVLPSWIDEEVSIQTKQKQELLLSPVLSGTLQSLAKSIAVPLKTVLLTAHLKVLGMLYGEQNITSGLICSVRPETVDADRALGVFLNTLPFPIKLKGGTWRDLIMQVFEAESELLKFRFYPVAQIQREHKKASLFDASFHFLHYHVANDLTQSENFQIVNWYEHIQANFTLEVACLLDIETSQIRIIISGDENKLSMRQLHSISDYFMNVIEDITENLSNRYDNADFLSVGEKQKLLKSWNDTKVDYPQNPCVHELFEEQVKKTPDAVAVIFEDQAITYSELNTKANQLAHYLRSKGVEAETLVGLYIERSLEMIIGLLGILKSGGAYVPLDPAYPQERINYMLEQSQVRIVLTQQDLCAQLSLHHYDAICLDDELIFSDISSKDSQVLHFVSQCTAYVIYTSGSTGRPKGVQICQHNLTNFLYAMRETFALTEQDNVLLLTSLSFDIAALEIYLPLTCGAKIVLASRASAQDAIRLASMIKEQQITFAQATPATWRMLNEFDFSGMNNLTLLSGGEALSSDLAKCLLDKSKDVWNLYGPTETTIWSAIYPVRKVEENIPIGQPIANTQIYLLDKNLNPVPPGTGGELYIGGHGLARGYLNQPDLTAERFIPDQFDKSGSRLYKTGDLARFRPDGNIEYLGRIDHQVKIRGFRIELGEIENQLLKHPDIKEAVLMVREDNPGDKRLCAYVIKQELNELDTGSLNTFLKETLPDYMLPNAYVFLADMPLTANGKLDRKSLPAPDLDTHRQKHYVAPRTETEIILADVWAEVLGLEKVGIEDNFFDLGGHSLIATQLVSRLCKRFKIDLPLRTLFETGTVEKLAEKIELALWLGSITNNGQTDDETDYEEIEL